VAKKKTKRRRSPAPGAEAQERRRERLDARRQARAAERAARRKAESRRRLVRAAVMGLVAAALGWLLVVQFSPEPTPDEIDGHRVQKFGESGGNEHVSGTVDYDSVPPTHGPHSATPAACGVHSEPIANENLVHSLEHGAVGILYLPTVPVDDIREVERLARSYDGRVLSAPYPDMPTPIAVVSWGEMMRLQALDRAAIRAYIDAFRGRGPEDVACPGTADDAFRPS
jgi:hypothetical protein